MLQVARLVAVLSVRGVHKSTLLEDCNLPDLSAEDAAVLQACGWTPGTGLAALLNFSGERVRHDKVERQNGIAGGEEPAAVDWKERISRVLQKGSERGRMVKPLPQA